MTPARKKAPAKKAAPTRGKHGKVRGTPSGGGTTPEPHAPTAVGPVRCGAKTRKGGACAYLAGYKTPHLGQGRCYLHGGLTPIKHGRYSSINRERIRELIAHHEADEDPLNLLPEVAALRAIFVDFIERYDETTEALIAWHADWQLRNRTPYGQVLALKRCLDEYEGMTREADGELTESQLAALAEARKLCTVLEEPADTGKPRTVLDVADAHRILDTLGKMVERIEKVRAANAISRPDLYRVLGEMGRVVEAHVVDEQVRTRIREGWLGIAV